MLGGLDAYTERSAMPTFGAGNGYATNELPVDMFQSTFEAFPSLTPLTSILSKLETLPATNFRIDWQESNAIPDKVIVGTALAAGGTALTVVANGPTLVINTLLFNPRANDIAMVSATPTTNAVTIVRSAAGSTGAAWLAGDALYVLPPYAIENESAVYRVASIPDTNMYNYMQLIRMQFCIDRTANAVSTHFGGPGSKREQLKQQKYYEFRKKWELLTYFGGRSSSGTAPASIRTMGGLNHYLRSGTLYKDFNGFMTHSGFRALCGDYKDQNPDSTNVWVFAAGNAIDRINDIAMKHIQLTPESQVYGMDIQRYKARGLTANLVALPLLTDSECRGWGWILDLDRIRLKMLDGGQPMFYPEALNIGESELIYDTYRVNTSLIVANETKHAMFVGAKL